MQKQPGASSSAAAGTATAAGSAASSFNTEKIPSHFLLAPSQQPSSSSHHQQRNNPVETPNKILNPNSSPLLIHHQLEKLSYTIHSYSSYSAQYHPKNILENKPNDQASRWSSGSNNQSQFIMLEFDHPAILQTITFGKYHKVHVCNMKEFKIYGGLSPSNMTELLHSGLRNDSEQETFSLKFKSHNVLFPCKFIKIVPLMAWGANFNFSIWYVELRGTGNEQVVSRALNEYSHYQESESIRLCLKHLRQRNLMDAFYALQKQTSLGLEHITLTELHKYLVLEGNFSSAEKILESACESGLFSEFIFESAYIPIWKRILSTDANGESPCMRGGHQMCIDDDAGIIYLLGGWDGKQDLGDFWAYDIKIDRWQCISMDTKVNGGPGPRSCHKVCFDPKTKFIYVLGRYIDPQSRSSIVNESDFYKFDTVHHQWIKISDNTAAQGGPDLIYDHQMCIDTDRQILYVFGGRVISSSQQSVSSENSYSGLFSYNMTTDVWQLIRNDSSQVDGSVQLKSRIGHSMLFNPTSRQLFIFAGQRLKDYLSDYYVYDIDSDKVIEMTRDSSKNSGPDAGFTQRATIDPDLDEFYVFSGLMREKNATTESVKNSFWVYSILNDKWKKIYQNENTGEDYWKAMENREPCPRFAHQLVYDQKNKVQYLFGGNPGEVSNMALRLDDFWSLKLLKPTNKDLLRKCKFLLKRQKFFELCQGEDALMAMKYLQTEVSNTVNHADEIESKEFRDLTCSLFEISSSSSSSSSSKGDQKKNTNHEMFMNRTSVYEKLLEYFPESMKQPKGNIVDLIEF